MPVREAVPAEVADIHALMLEHAAHEGAADQIALTADGLAEHLFGAEPTVRALVAEPPGAAGTVAGAALWHPTFSTWAGRSGIWLEDLYIRPGFRRHGLGRALLDELRSRTGGRVEWDVMRGNEDAAAFYRSLGAFPVDQWTRYRWLPAVPVAG
ncbi:GNAT family N-acetyltransferase [Streptomyces sp. A3M-1-3]|uniref:GNAT family N-acetyltransferase n=1 Tax=Streptomyces sp. A3M-1-3 TaxID=2962044 RepID=UPI0020B84306|nr:GNAT family N-acetyltransferase [Streptomyces sp. A3M-1-3]MCP3818173.1 GNAT family N-acetyltransferase [Streptomyces sp. A3M-1-3]